MNKLYRSDCKQVLEQLIADGVRVDLIYLDPPFNSNRAYNIIYDRSSIDAQSKAFDDTWRYTTQTARMLKDFEAHLEGSEDISPAVKSFLRTWINTLAPGDSQDERMIAYLIYMIDRFILMKKLLKNTGSFYLHCDPTASHYLKVLLDGIFGKENFKNEIVWRRTYAHNDPKRMGRNTDRLLFYTKSKEHNFYVQHTPYEESYIKKHFRHKDERGGYQSVILTAPRPNAQDPSWRGYHPAQSGRHWSIPKRIVEQLVGKERAQQMSVTERLDLLYENNYIVFSKNDIPRFKEYLHDMPGVPLQECWTDIGPIAARAQERLGYPTQKPLALLERIIACSTKEEDLVLDPFCGCGTTIEAAIKLKRNWIGIDISGEAVDITAKRRIAQYETDSKYAEYAAYEKVEGAPDTRREYERLKPFEKQDWLVRQLQGQPNPRKSGDQGVDGELRIHLGYKKEGRKNADRWGLLIFSVKTGKQCSPELVRELRGTMHSQGADMGVLILDKEPTPGMEDEAQKAGRLAYSIKPKHPPERYPRLQIITTNDIFDRRTMVRPPSIKEVMLHREHHDSRLFAEQ